jgi:rare lipoprotein A (peptidoglycan hydrolase)
VLVGALLSGALLGVPLLLLGTGAVVSNALPAGVGGGRTVATVPLRGPVGVVPGLERVNFVAPTTTTAAAPPTTTTTASPGPPVTAAARFAPTTTTAAPTDTATGLATWYAEAPPGRCASPSLPFGTELTIRDDATGAVITCLVDDREADNPGRVVDLSPEGFSDMAPLSQGVITVTVTW